MEKITVGADPEVFMKKEGRLVSAYGAIPGTKQHPFKVNKGAVQVDGMALEFNIDPAHDENEFVLNLTEVIKILQGMIGSAEIDISPVANFGKEYIDAQPLEAKMLGCDPDFNAWTQSVNKRPDAEAPFRTAAGHVHIGWTANKDFDSEHMQMCEDATKQLDFFLALPSVMYDKDKQRRQLYGKAGCFRPKPYGVEYRTLSNAWLKSESLIRMVYRNVQKAMNLVKNGVLLHNKYGDISAIINDSMENYAVEIMEKEGIVWNPAV